MSYGTPGARRAGKSAPPRQLEEGEENPPMGSGPSKEEARVERAVVEAMNKAARAGLGNRGRIRAGQRAYAKEHRQIEREKGLR